jgi:hypothetical protein
LAGALNMAGTVSMFNLNNPDSWINAFGGGANPEDYLSNRINHLERKAKIGFCNN